MFPMSVYYEMDIIDNLERQELGQKNKHIYEILFDKLPHGLRSGRELL
jgi:hypothetical protein